MTDRLEQVFAGIDAANAADPTLETSEPAALLYGRRMSAELERVAPDAPELLKIAARGQHIERWTIARSDYAEGRDGYLRWRSDLAEFHGRRVGEIMAASGYGEAEQGRVATMLRKQGLKRDAEVQLLEDVICLVFIRWYLEDFAETRDPEHVFRIVAKTARKMSAEGRERARREFDLPPNLAPAMAG